MRVFPYLIAYSFHSKCSLNIDIVFPLDSGHSDHLYFSNESRVDGEKKGKSENWIIMHEIVIQ